MLMEVFSMPAISVQSVPISPQVPASVKQAQSCTEIDLSPSYFPAEYPPQSCTLGDF